MIDKIKKVLTSYLETGILNKGYRLSGIPVPIENDYHFKSFSAQITHLRGATTYLVTYQVITPINGDESGNIYLVTGAYPISGKTS